MINLAYTSIRPGQTWLDTDGNRIQAHGCNIIIEDDIFYWYGTHKAKRSSVSDDWQLQTRFYASRDLYNWEYKGNMIYPENPESIFKNNSEHFPCARIIYNRRTGKYVAWGTYADDYTLPQSPYSFALCAMTSDSLMGPYTFVNDMHPFGMSAQFGDYAVDRQDGKGYLIFTRAHSELIIADLTEDFTNVTGHYSAHFPRVAPPYVREAPAYFYRRGKHYLFTSGTTSWFPNPSEVAMAETYHGPWTVLGDAHRNDPSRTSFNSQIFTVLRHPGKKDLYIALADRHLPRLPEQYPEEFNNGRFYSRVEKYMNTSKTDLPIGKLYENVITGTEYVWLPVRFDGETPYIEWLDEWRFEDFD